MNRGKNIQKKEFIRQLNELVPRPGPVTAETLHCLSHECTETEYIDTLTSLRAVTQNFSEETLQGAYEIIQYRNTTLSNEPLVAAAYLQVGCTLAEMSDLAKEGRLMGLFGSERSKELSQIATCTVVESGQKQRFYTMDFGQFNSRHALK